MPLRSICRPFETPSRRLGALQAHSSLRTLQQSVPRHPEIGEREQCVQLRRVLHQPAVAHLHKPELALDYTKRVLHLGPDASIHMITDRQSTSLDLQSLILHSTALT